MIKTIAQFLSKTQHKVPPPAPTPPPPNIQFISMPDLEAFLESEKTLHIPLIREGCRVCNIPFVGGGTIFFPQGATLEDDFKELGKWLNSQLYSNVDYLIAYEKLERPLTNLSYYKVIAIKSNDMLDFKKAFKIQKLKAFL